MGFFPDRDFVTSFAFPRSARLKELQLAELGLSTIYLDEQLIGRYRRAEDGLV